MQSRAFSQHFLRDAQPSSQDFDRIAEFFFDVRFIHKPYLYPKTFQHSEYAEIVTDLTTDYE